MAASYNQHVSLLEALYRKPGVSLADVAEAPEQLECLIQDVFDDLQDSRSQLRKQVTDLEVRNKELEEYAYMVAHDLKEPLTVLILNADLIRNVSDLTEEEARECQQQMAFTAYEMRSIIQNLLLFAEVDKAEAPRGVVQMGQVVANVQARLSYRIREKQAQLLVPAEWPDALGYGPWIEEVWANLLSNALKYGGCPPHVELGASLSSDGMLRFWTRDHGPGIPLEVRTRMFTPGTPHNRLSRSTEGLGLPIVYSIVEKLGGQVGIESEEGQGSLFYFTLPAA